MDLEDTIVMVLLILGGNASIHSSWFISFNIVLFAVSEGKCLVQVIQQDLSSSVSAASGAEMEQVVKLQFVRMLSTRTGLLQYPRSLFFFSYFSGFISDCVIILLPNNTTMFICII